MTMQLSEHKTYRTRDGSRTGIRVIPHEGLFINLGNGRQAWTCDGKRIGRISDHHDLVEEKPGSAAFFFAACPLIGDGPRRRAVTRDGREVVLLCDDAPGQYPIVGFMTDNGSARWSDGTDLLVPPPQKRVVWVNPYDPKSAPRGPVFFNDEREADLEAARHSNMPRLGNRAHRIEVDE